MVKKDTLREIKKYEEAGIDVVATSKSGKLLYSTKGYGDDSKYCDQCSAFRLQPDPDPSDWFRDGDMKAVCLQVNGVIAGALERPSEYTNICKPLFCPKLGRKLTKEEKEEAKKRLKWAKKLMKMS